ncbi:MAG: GNAT family N-acetyltransferase [Oscillospiraceae bacterium]
MIHIENLQEKHLEKLKDFRQEFEQEGIRISGSVGLESADSVESWFYGQRHAHYGDVKEKIYVAFDQNNDLVGIADLRLEVNDFIRQYAGRIGYSIRKSQRGKGYSVEMLRLVLLEAKKEGLSKVLVTCNENNIASSRTIERAGGKLEAIIEHPGFPRVKRYWFDL